MSSRRRARTAWLVSALFLAGCSVRSMLYPAPGVAVGEPPAGYEEVFWTLDDGVAVQGWFGAPAVDQAELRPVVLFFHGNGENLETLKRAGIFDRWRLLGVAAVAAEYPGYGGSGGRASEEALLAGGSAALAWTRERFPDRPIVVAGWSLGAAVAVQLAAATPQGVESLILVSPWTRLIDVAGVHFPAWLARLLLRDRYDSLAAAGSVTVPTLVIHGEADRIIPVSHGREIVAALEPRATWAPVPGAGHNDLLGRPEVWERIAVFLDGEQGL